MEEQKITQIDIEEWPVTILVVSDEHPKTILHAVLYQKTPGDIDLESLKVEFIEEFDYQDDTKKLKYIEVPTEEFMKMIGAEEVEDDD